MLKSFTSKFLKWFSSPRRISNCRLTYVTCRSRLSFHRIFQTLLLQQFFLSYFQPPPPPRKKNQPISINLEVSSLKKNNIPWKILFKSWKKSPPLKILFFPSQPTSSKYEWMCYKCKRESIEQRTTKAHIRRTVGTFCINCVNTRT